MHASRKGCLAHCCEPRPGGSQQRCRLGYFFAAPELLLPMSGTQAVVLLVVPRRVLDRFERNGDVLFTHAEKSAYANDQRADLAFRRYEDVHYLTDLVVRGVVNVLLVPIRHRDALARYVVHRLRARRRRLCDRCRRREKRGQGSRRSQSGHAFTPVVSLVVSLLLRLCFARELST
jgi:hypothetical protein